MTPRMSIISYSVLRQKNRKIDYCFCSLKPYESAGFNEIHGIFLFSIFFTTKFEAARAMMMLSLPHVYKSLSVHRMCRRHHLCRERFKIFLRR